MERGREASRPDVVRFSYGELGEVTNDVAWDVRAGMLSRCLLGTGLGAALPATVSPAAAPGSIASPTKASAAVAAASSTKALPSSSTAEITSPSPAQVAAAAKAAAALAEIAEQCTGRGLFDVVDWYRAIFAADAFTSGPIEQQYATFRKYPKQPTLMSPPPRSYSAQARRQTGAATDA